MQPYQDQQKAIDQVRAEFSNGHRAVLLVIPTGGGKTPTAGFLARDLLSWNLSVVFMAHRDNLIRQASTTFQRIIGDHGVIAPGIPHTRNPVQIASVQTLVRRLGSVFPPDVIIIDEAHHVSRANQWARIVAFYPLARILGITATPCRTDGMGLGSITGGIFTSIVYGLSVVELINLGRLVRLEHFGASQTHFDPSGISTADDYNQQQVSKQLVKSKIVGDAVDHYLQHAKGLRALAFCVSVEMAKDTAEAFRSRGIPAGHIDGTMSRHEQRKAINDLAERTVMVLTSVDVVSEGTDIPAVDCGIMMRPTSSLGLWMQQLGRIMRASEGKRTGIILDMVGNTARHGFADDHRVWELNPAESVNTRKTSQDIAKARQCERCFRIYISGPVCPHCGHEHKGARTIEMTSGELRHLERRQAEQQALELAESVRASVRKVMTLDDWIRKALESRYNPAWAMIRFNQRGGRADMKMTMKRYKEIKNEME